MSKWFKDYSDSDSDSDSQSSSESSTSTGSVSDSEGGLKKWLRKEKTDDADDMSKGDVILSGEYKREQNLVQIEKSISESINNEDWFQLIGSVKKLDKIIKKYPLNSKIVTIFNYLEENLISVINVLKAKNENNKTYFNRSVKLVKEILDQYEYSINLFNRPIDNPKDDNKINSLENKFRSILATNDINQLKEFRLEAQNNFKIYVQVTSLLTNHISQQINSVEIWIEFLKNMKELVEIIQNNKDYYVIDADCNGYKDKKCITLYTILSLSFDKLHKQYIYLLQNCRPQTASYIHLVTYENVLLTLCEDVIGHYKLLNKYDTERYMKISSVLLHMMNISYFTTKSISKMKRWYNMVSKHSISSEDRVMACLYYTYNLLVNDRYDEARKLLLTSGCTIETDMPIETEEIAVMYNQVLVKLGVQAFKHNRIVECFDALTEICQNTNKMILLGQFPLPNKNYLLIPSHRHINLEMTKEIYLFTCLLLDTPNEDRFTFFQRKPISKYYASILHRYYHIPLYGEIKTSEEKIYKASRLILSYDWKGAYEHLQTLHYFNLYDNKYILNNIKMTTLQVFIKQGQEFYKNIYFEDMIKMFELKKETIQENIEVGNGTLKIITTE